MYHIKTLLFSFCSGDIYLFSDSHFMPQSSGSFQGIGENMYHGLQDSACELTSACESSP